ncbi:WRKY3 [Artemisia annua]|uniref:WRKY3 n=2 Tax=Artemisia annua TaxID=35608 RepID=A0A2U1N8R5_ARTAN|nr:WRKY3 [Artemisia annua]
MAVDLVGIQTIEHLNRIFQNHDFGGSSSFREAVSALKRSGHARFRRGPSHAPSSVQHAPSVSKKNEEKVTEVTSSMMSSFAGGDLEGSVSNGKSLGIVSPAPSFSSRKPPLPSSHRKRSGNDLTSASVHGSRTGCHCCKRRKTGSKRKVKMIPIIGSKVDSIPADDYSWKKYGEKKVSGTQFPRVYYKCNSVKGCPARKRVELSLTDSKMLIVTYDGEHQHPHRQPTPLPVSMTGLRIDSK